MSEEHTPQGRVERVAHCRLQAGTDTWDYARENAVVIDAHWAQRHAENPALFNGIIYMMIDHCRADAGFDATFLRTDFKSYLYWRANGFPAAGATDTFGSALIRSAEGHVVLGRQRAGNVNSGLAYLPGGFIDHRDVAADGTIDIDASIARELMEETGLAASAFTRVPGYLLTFQGALISIACELRSALPAREIAASIRAHIAADPNAELIDAVVVTADSDLAGHEMPAYARVLLSQLFTG